MSARGESEMHEPSRHFQHIDIAWVSRVNKVSQSERETVWWNENYFSKLNIISVVGWVGRKIQFVRELF